jgi:uncharacterized membrane protein
MNKAIILPLISGAALLIKTIFGFEIGTEDQDTYANMILAAIAIYGIFKDPKQKSDQ